MSTRLMILPSTDPARIRLVRIPEDMEAQEAFRHATGVIAGSEERSAGDQEEIDDALEAQGYERVQFILGPTLD